MNVSLSETQLPGDGLGPGQLGAVSIRTGMRGEGLGPQGALAGGRADG